MLNPVIFWFRRDLRLHDNAGLYHALKSGKPVLPVFIFDTNILNKLEDKNDARVSFIHKTLGDLKSELKAFNSDLRVYYGTPANVFKEITEQFKPSAVYTNHDYEPYATERDKEIEQFLKQNGIAIYTYKDQCIFEKSEVVKDNGEPYTVFTPYSKKWKAKLTPFFYKAYPSLTYAKNFLRVEPSEMISLASMGFGASSIQIPAAKTTVGIIKNYSKNRDFPSLDATSHLGIHFRFGTISIREKLSSALTLSETWVNELIWRDFYMQILYHFPHVSTNAFKSAYDRIQWRNNEKEFELWCAGKTGYPIVDAGMRQLNKTGYMHNRVRMIVASFLTKHLLIDWRWGEAYFAKKLLDFDLSANNGGWQWAAGSGTDAAPYFRVFNPALQTEKFDKNYQYIRKWVPEFGTAAYPKPIVEHTLARDRCLKAYKEALS